jgi:RHS repeat-associated protein
MDMDGTWLRVKPYEDRYRYNHKELTKGLGWYAYGARYYDAAIGRFAGVDPIADEFPHVTTYNYAEDSPVDGIDLWGLQYVHFSKSFYSASRGQNWMHTSTTQTVTDAYGDTFYGNMIPFQQVKFTGKGANFPLYSGDFARSLEFAGNNLSTTYENTPRTKSNKLDQRSAKAYNQTSNAASGIGKLGLAFIAVDIATSAYTTINGYSESVESDEQLKSLGKAWEDVKIGIQKGMIGTDFQNIIDLGNIANFVYQGVDQFGDNEALRNTAINISKNVSGNYRGGDEYYQGEQSIDNFHPPKILARPPNGVGNGN